VGCGPSADCDLLAIVDWVLYSSVEGLMMVAIFAFVAGVYFNLPFTYFLLGFIALLLDERE
jgi:hypothetical protein